MLSWWSIDSDFVNDGNFFTQCLNFFKLLRGFTAQAINFFTYSINLTAIGLGDVSLWHIFAIGGLVIFLVALIAKKIIPFS